MALWRESAFEVIISSAIISEVERALMKPYFRRRVSLTEARQLSRLMARRARLVEITEEVSDVASASQDDLIIATAVSGRAGYLVTGDRALRAVGRYADVTFVTPREFLDVLRDESVAR